MIRLHLHLIRGDCYKAVPKSQLDDKAAAHVIGSLPSISIQTATWYLRDDKEIAKKTAHGISMRLHDNLFIRPNQRPIIKIAIQENKTHPSMVQYSVCRVRDEMPFSSNAKHAMKPNGAIMA
jgi:hypothetical protein